MALIGRITMARARQGRILWCMVISVERLAASCLHEEGRDDRRRLSCLPAILRAFLLIGAGGFLERGNERKDVPAKHQSFFHIFEFRALFDVGIHKYPPKKRFRTHSDEFVHRAHHSSKAPMTDCFTLIGGIVL